jgi:FkbM family methyltransferase
VDVGANPVHPPPYDVLMQQQACRVVGFEPQEEAYNTLVANAAENETYVQAALGKPGKATLYAYPIDGFTSLYKLREASLAYLGKFMRQIRLGATEHDVTLTTLDQLDDVPPIDLLKIDVQGAEVDIFRGGTRKLSQAVAVIPEVRYYRLYEDEPLLGDMDVELRKQGFVLHKFLKPKIVQLPNSQAARFNRKEIRNQWMDGDAVYIRDMEDLGAWTDDQLCHLAILAGCVFDSQDLCVRCLDHLVERGVVAPEVPSAYVDLLPDSMLALDTASVAAQ